jgi:hypothetical protein
MIAGTSPSRLLALTLACGALVGVGTANASMLQLTGGAWQTTPAQVIGDVTAGNDILTSPVHFWDNATLTTNTAIVLTFYYVGAESGYTNYLNVAPGHIHADTDQPADWNRPALFSITLGAGQTVPISFTSSGFNGSLLPGGGVPQGNDNYDKSIGFAILSCINGSPACFSQDQSLLAGDILAFMLDDGGANLDDNHDDYVGYMVATPVPAVPVPAAAWLLLSGLGALGVVRRQRNA